ncbi:hypothetical protein C8034_v002253 [Colletotrichum sidae]|uniref:DUF4604 domain-containing protein n=1 Tax=Colletotrichum sidae TaxID=1347389 RepID=A0A4V6QFM3_9PEZI|nr:hypothetical protein C8034_v002253 [Colletotrichum sidae]
MSDKITAKNLSYDTNIPPFLRALHAQAAGNSADPDPILSKRRRAGKKRSASEEAEDAPLVVDDEGNVVDVRVDKDGAVEESQAVKEDGEERRADANEDKRDAEKLAGIGGSKKRKAGKVIGEGVEDGEDGESKEKEAKEEGGSKKKAGKKKGKKIKLSFDEPE